jgi:electron transport complex protein RnfA
MEYIIIIISAIFVNNIVLAQFLGICPFLGVSKKVNTAVGMAGAVLFVMTLATIVTWLIETYFLAPTDKNIFYKLFNLSEVIDLRYLRTIAYILVIASLVQMVEIILKKISPPLYQALGIFLPLITTNCAVLGVALLTVQKEFNLLEGVVFAIGNAIGFALALLLFAGLREHTELMKAPKGMKGVPIAFVIAGILALAFMGFAGLV